MMLKTESVTTMMPIPEMANPVELQTRNLTCIECHQNFVFSAGEQSFFLNRGLSNEPRRCPHCRVLMRMRREGKSTDLVTKVDCAECGEKTTVPFLPKEGKKIFCAVCLKASGFKKHRSEIAVGSSIGSVPS